MPTPAFNLAYLEFRRSSNNPGGTPSCGGAIAPTAIWSQSATAPTQVTGVQILGATGNTTGPGTLTYTFSGQTLTWTHAGGQATTAVAVGGGDGRYTLQTAQGQTLFVNVTVSSLPTSNKSESITISDNVNTMFDDVTKSQSWYGQDEYRCFYYVNLHPTDTALDLKVWIGSQPSNAVETLYIGKDPAGKGNGSTTGVATTISGETVAPANVTLNTITTLAAALAFGDLGPGEAVAVWVQRKTPGGQLTAFPTVTAQINARVVI